MATRQPLGQIENLSLRNPAAKGAGRKSFIQNVMVRNSSSLSSTSVSSTNSSAYPPSVLSTGWEADDEDSLSMSADDYVPSRPISVSIPNSRPAQGPYCPRRPNLREILANTSESPWTLAAFMAYLSSNHCLETLEFTMDAGRYRKHYSKMMSKAGANGMPPSKDRDYVQALWERLVEAYIQPSGSREVNIPSDVRDPILRLRPDKLPPAPEKLDPAVAKIYELMEESVLVPFLNSVYPQAPHPTVGSWPSHTSADSVREPELEDPSAYRRRNRHARDSPPPRTAVQPYSSSYSPPPITNRRSAPSPSHPTNKITFNTKLTQSTSSPARSMPSSKKVQAPASASDPNASGSGSGPGMTDDGGSTDSPANESPTTPPTSPPLSDTLSPYTKRDSGMWKRFGRMSGMKATKKRSDGGLKEEQ